MSSPSAASQGRVDRFRTKRCSEASLPLLPEEVQKTKFFSGRSQAFITAVVDFFQLEVFTDGEQIMKEGEEGDKLLFLHRGTVNVFVGPQELLVASLGPGTVFGEMALLGAFKRTATIRAAEFCDCRVLAKHVFQRLLRKFPEEKEFFEQMARERMEELERVKAENSGARRSSFRLPTLHAEGKQRLRKNVLPKAAQTAVDAFLSVRRRKSTGGILGSHGIAPRTYTDPCLPSSLNGEDSSAHDRICPVAEKAVSSFLALRRGSNETAPRIHTDTSLPRACAMTDESSSEDETDRDDCPVLQKNAKELTSVRRSSAPASNAVNLTCSTLPTLDDLDDSTSSSEEDEDEQQRVADFSASNRQKSDNGDVENAQAHAVVRTALKEDGEQTVDATDLDRNTYPQVASSSLFRRRASGLRKLPPCDAHPTTLNPTVDHSIAYPQNPRSPRFRRSFICGGLRTPTCKGNLFNSDAEPLDHKRVLYNVVACQL